MGNNRTLTERLRSGFGGIVPEICDEAANVIDKLERELARANSAHDVHMAEIAGLRERLTHFSDLVQRYKGRLEDSEEREKIYRLESEYKESSAAMVKIMEENQRLRADAERIYALARKLTTAFDKDKYSAFLNALNDLRKPANKVCDYCGSINGGHTLACSAIDAASRVK